MERVTPPAVPTLVPWLVAEVIKWELVAVVALSTVYPKGAQAQLAVDLALMASRAAHLWMPCSLASRLVVLPKTSLRKGQ